MTLLSNDLKADDDDAQKNGQVLLLLFFWFRFVVSNCCPQHLSPNRHCLHTVRIRMWREKNRNSSRWRLTNKGIHTHTHKNKTSFFLSPKYIYISKTVETFFRPSTEYFSFFTLWRINKLGRCLNTHTHTHTRFSRVCIHTHTPW